MAGVRRLKELSTLRASRGISSLDARDNDDDSRPISPDKQLKNFADNSRKPASAGRPTGLGPGALLPKQQAHRPRSSSNRRTAAKAPAPAPRSTFEQQPQQPAPNALSTAKALTARLRRSYSLPSRESSSSSVGAADNHTQLLLSAANVSISRTSSRGTSQSSPAGGSATASAVARAAANGHSRRNSRSANSSRSSSRGVTPPPASPANGFHAGMDSAVMLQQQHRCSSSKACASTAGAVLGGVFVAPTCTADDVYTAEAAARRKKASQHQKYNGFEVPAIAATGDGEVQRPSTTPPATPVDPAAVISARDDQAACIRGLLERHQQGIQQQQHQRSEHQQEDAHCHQQSQQPQHADTTAAVSASSEAGEASVMSSLDDLELEEVSRDVAARIIQAHWRLYVGRKHAEQQLDLEQTEDAQGQQQQQQQQADPAESGGRCGTCAKECSEHWKQLSSSTAVQQQQQHLQQQESAQLADANSPAGNSSEQSFGQTECVQQLLDQLQLEPDALAAFSNNPQLRALLTAALGENQQKQDEQQQQQQQGWHTTAETSKFHSSSDAGEQYESAAAADTADDQQQQQHIGNNSCDLLDDQSVLLPASAATAAAADPAQQPALCASPVKHTTRGVLGSCKPAALGRLRRSMEDRQAQQLQQYMSATAGAESASAPVMAEQHDDVELEGSRLQPQLLLSQQQQQQQQQQDAVLSSPEKSVATCYQQQNLQHQQQLQPVQQTPKDSSQALRYPAEARQDPVTVNLASHAPAAAGAGGKGSSTMSDEKLGTILAYLDAVDAEAEEEAAGMLNPSATQGISRESSHYSRTAGSLISRSRQPSRPLSGGSAAAAAAQVAPSQRPATASSLGNAGLLQQQMFVSPCFRPVSAHQQQHVGQLMSMLEQHEQQQQEQQLLLMTEASAAPTQHHQQQQFDSSSGAALMCEPSAALSTGGYSMVSQGNRSAVLAESVFGGVKAKISRLRAALAEKEEALQALQQDVQDSRQRHADQLSQLAQVHEQELAAAASDAAAAVSRHLAFIDRLMEDKGQLNKQMAEVQAAAKSAEERHAAAIAALKAGWAAELKRQQASWEAGHAAKQDAWRAEKTKEIKEQTVKGLEVEVQRLITRHRAELASSLDKAAEQAKQAAEQAKAQHEAHVAALKERLRQEQEEALERERASSAARLREACERYESQMQSARLRLLADTDIKLEAAAVAAREEKRKGEAAVEAAVAAAKQREQQLRDNWAREKDDLARVHARALDQAKTAAQEERSAWRAAVTEKIKRQAMEREEQLRAALIKERDAEIDLVIQRLEAEQQAALQAARDKIAADHAATIAALEDRLKEAQRGASRLGDKARASAASAAVAERQRDEVEQQLEQLRQEIQAQDQQLSAAQAALAAKEAEGRTATAAAGAAASQALKELAAEKGQLEAKVTALSQQLQQLREQHEAEMVHVEYRVKGVIAKKDDAIVRLQQQLSSALEQMRGTEAVLAAQQAELYE